MPYSEIWVRRLLVGAARIFRTPPLGIIDIRRRAFSTAEMIVQGAASRIGVMPSDSNA